MRIIDPLYRLRAFRIASQEESVDLPQFWRLHRAIDPSAALGMTVF
jgi:hypothetical protein